MTLAQLTINEMAVFAEIAMVLFLCVFVGVAAWALRRPKSELSTWARLPLDETAGGEPDTKH